MIFFFILILYILNYHLFQKLKPIKMNELNHLIYILTLFASRNICPTLMKRKVGFIKFLSTQVHVM
jgi:hypothetical protein